MAITARVCWALVRAWAEGVPFHYTYVANLAGVEERYVRDLARRQKWVIAGKNRSGSALISAFRSSLWQRAEHFFMTPATGTFDKAEADQLQVMLKILERLEAADSPETVADCEKRKVAIAQALKRIDERIHYLARNFAREAPETASDQQDTGQP